MSIGLEELVRVALDHAADLIIEVLEPSPYKRRLVFRDRSFLDLYLSISQSDIYAFHFERRHIDETLFRVDNYPHHSARQAQSFPHHFHNRRDAQVKESAFGISPEGVLVNFLAFIREKFF